MTGNNKTYRAFIKGEYRFTHAADQVQAAVALAQANGLKFVDPAKVYEVKPLYLYRVFLRDSNYNAYGYRDVAAKSQKQAAFLMNAAYGYRNWGFEGSFSLANPGTSLGDVIDADWSSASIGSVIQNIKKEN